MASGSVSMAMREFLRGGGTDIDDLNVEGYSFVGQRVVGVHVDIELAHLDDGHLSHAFVGIDTGHHAGLRLCFADQVFDGNALVAAVAAKTIRLLGTQSCTENIAAGSAFKSFFQSWQDIAVPVQIERRLAVARSLELCAIGLSQTVVKSDDTIFGNVHEGSIHR